MLLFDIGANRGDVVRAGLEQGFRVIALEPSRIYSELLRNYIYDERVIALKFAVSDKDYQKIDFYECIEDGLSTTNKDWLTDPSMPYCGKEYRTTSCTTITIDTLVKLYGEPDLIKIDVEGAEWAVIRGMSKPYKMTFEWTLETLDQHQEQIEYLKSLGYTRVAPQFIEHHLQEPTRYYDINLFKLDTWVKNQAPVWIDSGWKKAGLRPTADVGMLWFSQ